MRSMFRTALLFVLLSVAFVTAWPQEKPLPALDKFGGLTEAPFAPGSFFRTEFDGTRWWLVTPEGHGFFSVGINHVTPSGDPIRGTSEQPYLDSILREHGSEEAWADATLERYHAWGINTIGAWSCDHFNARMPYTKILGLSGSWGGNAPPDFFAPEFAEDMKNGAAQATPYKDDPWLVGYFLANELPWAKDHRRGPSLFDAYCVLPADAPGKQRLIAFFRDRYESFEAFAKVWRDAPESWEALGDCTHMSASDQVRATADREAFTLEAARKYFEVATGALRAADPNHLVLGCRFIWQRAPRAVVQACGEYCDVVTINFYEMGWLGQMVVRGIPDGVPILTEHVTDFASWYDLVKKPLMITEFSFRGGDALPPNSYPPGYIVQPVVPTQADRAEKFDRYASMWSRTPWFVGYHWFQHSDEPAEGRFDGEDGNYGLVDIHDTPHAGFVERFSAVNWRILEGLVSQSKK